MSSDSVIDKKIGNAKKLSLILGIICVLGATQMEQMLAAMGMDVGQSIITIFQIMYIIGGILMIAGALQLEKNRNLGRLLILIASILTIKD